MEVKSWIREMRRKTESVNKNIASFISGYGK